MLETICTILAYGTLVYLTCGWFWMGFKILKKIRDNALFRYDRELAKRFVSDLKLPISVIYPEHIFHYQLKLYGCLTAWENLWKLIDEKFDGDQKKFLEDYYQIRDKIIKDTLANPAYVEFTKMDMKKFAFGRPEGISKNNVYNGENLDKVFLSVDMSKANFQALRYVSPDIVLGAQTYEDFIGKFTDIDYIAKSKYSRQVIFGKLNVERQMTVERWLTNQIYELLKAKLSLGFKKYKDVKLVSMSNDELIYDITGFGDDDEHTKLAELKKSIEVIVDVELDLKVHTEAYSLNGWQLVSPTNSEFHQTFFEKVNLFPEDYDDESKLVCVPLPFHNLIYKLWNNKTLCPDDKYFVYEKMMCQYTDNFKLIPLEKNGKRSAEISER